MRAWESLGARREIEVVAFLDNDVRRREMPFLGLPVLAPADLDPSAVDGLLIGSMYADAIVRQLVELGVPRARIYTDAGSLVSAVREAPPVRQGVRAGATPLRILNFQVNDICNARCVMCNVWKQKRDRELTPEEFATLIADPYFSELEHAGITGGEPTLRPDLAEFYLALLDRCQKLKGGSFITHGLDTERVLAVYPRVAEAYRARGVDFRGMVSIDGIGGVHDQVRGRAGAFERATRTLNALNEAGVPTIAACTVVRSNVWGLRDLLEWGQANNVYVRFRVGEFINRLYNGNAHGEIRAFDPAETSEIISFFQHLIESYEPDEAVRRTYASIISLVAGGERLIGCPYRTSTAVSVDCRGRFAVCAPKGIYHPLGAEAAAAVREAEGERQAIERNHCGSCIHDCHDEWLPVVAEEMTIAAVVKARLASAPGSPVYGAEGQSREAPRQVLVLGWYGTRRSATLRFSPASCPNTGAPIPRRASSCRVSFPTTPATT